MKSIGTYKIYLTGSKKYIRRAVRTPIHKMELEDRYYVFFAGEYIEVKRASSDFYTVELY